MDLIPTIQTHVDALHPILQFLAVFAVGLVPFLEGDSGAIVGVLAGIPWPVVIIAAFAGTLLSSLVVVRLSGRLADPGNRGERDRRVLSRAERWGIPAAMLVSGVLLSVIITALIMAGARLHRPTILLSAAVTALLNVGVGVLVGEGVIQLTGIR